MLVYSLSSAALVSGTENEQMKLESGTVSDSAVAQTTSTAAEARCCTDPDCKCPAHFLSPLAIGTSPDSGIEFDRWTSAPGEWDKSGETHFWHF
jgi:hypothetical protein